MLRETNGKRGANEIGSILYKYLAILLPTIINFRLISDSCSKYKNRNQYLAAILLHAIQVLPIEAIDQKFLVPRHTQMECNYALSNRTCSISIHIISLHI